MFYIHHRIVLCLYFYIIILYNLPTQYDPYRYNYDIEISACIVYNIGRCIPMYLIVILIYDK